MVDKKRYYLIGIVTLATIILDQFVKWLVHSKNLTGDFSFVKIQKVINTGAAFGIFRGSTIPLIFISLIVIGVILFYMDRTPNKKLYNISVALILGGAIGNLIDRIFFGYVKDFISIYIWPTFNIADSAICVGIIMWIILNLKEK